ncbi:ABC transporter permease [Nonomuraea sp. NPDC050540]|uniref:ABC transporter permease n=1 Tax=Nonomuraea sp. NPDC050540 TaxID=3364367 RepID=UPI0037BC0CD9
MTGYRRRGVVGVALLLAGLEALGRASGGTLPPAGDILARAAALALEPGYLSHLAGTLFTWAGGTLLATVLAIPAGLLLGTLPGVERASRAVLEFLRPMPGVALFPLVGMMLGSGATTRLVVVTYVALWPVLFNAVYGLRDVEPVAVDTLRAFGFGRTAVLVRVSLPSAAPFIATGVRLAAGIALIATIAGEIYMGTGQGIGVHVAQSTFVPDATVEVLAVTVWAALLGLLANTLLVRGERRLFSWAHR